MNGMRKERVIRLARIDFPRDLLAGSNILFDKYLFRFGRADRGGMTLRALGDRGNAPEGAVCRDLVTHVACHAVLFAGMNGVIELHWLRFTPVEDGGKDKPSNGQRSQNT
jgi:hypothetical protein